MGSGRKRRAEVSNNSICRFLLNAPVHSPQTHIFITMYLGVSESSKLLMNKQ